MSNECEIGPFGNEVRSKESKCMRDAWSQDLGLFSAVTLTNNGTTEKFSMTVILYINMRRFYGITVII